MLDIFTPQKRIEETAVIEPQIDMEVLGFNQYTFTWDDSSYRRGTSQDGRGRRFKLKLKEKLTFEWGGINLIVGPTGSGKVRLILLCKHSVFREY